MAITESCAPADPRHYVWWFPGSPVKVHLDFRVIEELQKRLQGSGLGIAEQGLLFGRVSDGATEIVEFQPASNRTVPEMIAAISAAPGKRFLVGYYRTEQGEMLRLNEADLSLFNQFFGNSYQVFLVIQPSAFAAPNATFFFCRDDHKMADFPFLEFPLDASLLATEERDRISRCRQAAEISPPAQHVSPPPLPNSRPDHRLVNLIGVGTLLAGLTLLALWIGIRSLRPHASQAWNTFWKSAAVPSSSAKSYPHIGLQARRQDRDLELSWNRESPWVTAATSGLISIKDGSTKRQISLDSQQLRGESILYSPTSDQVLIQLTITTPAGVTTESVRAFLLQSEIGKISRPEPFQNSGISAETHSRSEHNEPTPTPKPFTIPTVPKSNPPATVPLLHELPPPDLHSETPPSRIISLGLSQIPVLPQMARRSAAAPPPTAKRASPPLIYQPPIPLTKVSPIFPPDLRALIFKTLTVAVRVTIDTNGKVLKAEPLPQGNIHRLFVAEAIHAARLWTFQPAQRGNEAVPSDSVLHFTFRQ
jgi:hypothetical protein